MLRFSSYVKIRVVAPKDIAEIVREALVRAGAGVQGNYSQCSFSYPVTGRFLAEKGANPAIGEIGKLQIVEEEVIETICHTDKVTEVIRAVKAVHPYEEPAIDIVPRFELE